MAEERDLATAGQIAGTVVGGIVGGPVGGAVGGLVGAWAGGLARGEVGPSTPIGYNSQVGNGGGFFPKSVKATATAFGTTDALLLKALKKFGFTPSLQGKWWTSGELKVFASGGLIEALKQKPAAAKGYLLCYKPKVKQQNWRNLALWVDGFVNKDGGTTSGGGKPTADGCGEASFYGSAAAVAAGYGSITSSNSNYAPLRAICLRCGFDDYDISGWGLNIRHASSVGLANSLKPNPGNGSRDYSRNGLRTATEALKKVSATWGGSATDWASFFAQRSKKQNIALPPMAWVIMLLLARFLVRGLNKKGVVDDALAVLRENWPALASRAWLEWLYDSIVFGDTISSSLRKSIATKLMRTIRDDGGVVISDAVWPILGNLGPYQDAIDIYSNWKRSGTRYKRVVVVGGRLEGRTS